MDGAIQAIREESNNLKKQFLDTTYQLADMHSLSEAIIETINDPVLILEKDLRVRSATKRFYDKFNTTESNTEGYYFYELKSCPWNSSELIKKLEETIRNKSSFSDFEINCTLPGTGDKVFRINARHIESVHEISLLIISINDITTIRSEKKQMVENKYLLEERIRLAVESADMGTWEMNMEDGMIIWDQRCQELFGIQQAQVSYEDFLITLHPDDRLVTDDIITKVTTGANDGKYNTEYRTRFERENNTRWLKASGRAYFNETGKAVRFAGTVMDITQQKLNEELLRESEERFRLASDAAAAMIWLSGTDKMCNYFNKSWFHFTGRSFEEEKGIGWASGLYAEDLDKYMDVYNSNFDSRIEFYLEYRLRRHDGQYRWISDSGVPRFSPEGIFEGYIGTCIDIHDQKMTQGELEKLVSDRTQLLSDAINNLEVSNHNLEEFAYVASHDLQEPLRKIQTFANRLQGKSGHSLDEETKLYLSKITNASERMSRLIADLLNYSRLQKSDYPIETVDLNEIINNVLNDFDLVIQEKKGIIHLNPLPLIIAVSMRMTQLFHNLVSNALKFSRHGHPPVVAIYAGAPPDDIKDRYPSLKKDFNYTMITFSDNGIGFNEEFAEKIFNIFQRLNGVSEYEGTGIGLAICRKIVVNHHGVIFAESRENEGTFFRIILPVD